MSEFTPDEIRKDVLDRYTRIADDPSTESVFPVGRDHALSLEYVAEELDALPRGCVDRFAGVGNPFTVGPIPEGATVLDIGPGAGMDCLLAARRVGPNGRVIGVDLTPKMLESARAYAAECGVETVEFVEGAAENLPVDDASIDVVISNGVINLCPDKAGLTREVFRVLKPGGVLQTADISLVADVSPETIEQVGSWSD